MPGYHMRTPTAMLTTHYISYGLSGPEIAASYRSEAIDRADDDPETPITCRGGRWASYLQDWCILLRREETRTPLARGPAEPKVRFHMRINNEFGGQNQVPGYVLLLDTLAIGVRAGSQDFCDQDSC